MKLLGQVIEKDFAAYHGDCIDGLRGLDAESIDYIIFSPPFQSLYVYSNSDRDMGNSHTAEQFWIHYSFLSKELMRVLKPGRNMSVHCMDLPLSKSRHGEIQLQDFPGDLIRAHREDGFLFHSKATIWKDPVVAMQRTKALGLLWKQIKKDSSLCRQGIPDYMITFRKPGVNPKPIAHSPEEFPVSEWQNLASPCWMDIRQSNTLNRKLAREGSDERHIAPLQLDLIERCLRLWSAPGDVVLSPFMGIGSEGFVSLQMGRKFVGFELKKSYFDVATSNLTSVDFGSGTGSAAEAAPIEDDPNQLTFGESSP